MPGLPEIRIQIEALNAQKAQLVANITRTKNLANGWKLQIRGYITGERPLVTTRVQDPQGNFTKDYTQIPVVVLSALAVELEEIDNFERGQSDLSLGV